MVFCHNSLKGPRCLGFLKVDTRYLGILGSSEVKNLPVK